MQLDEKIIYKYIHIYIHNRIGKFTIAINKRGGAQLRILVLESAWWKIWCNVRLPR